MKKRILAMFLAVFLVSLSVAPGVSANAAENPVISLPAVDAAPGETVALNLSISGNPGIMCMSLTLKYDTSVLTLTKAKNGDVFDSLASGTNLVLDSEENSFENGALATCTFQVAAGAASGTYPITITMRECLDEDYDDVSCSVVNGSVRIATEEPPQVFLDTASLSLADTIDVNFYTILTNAVTADTCAYALFTGPNGPKQVLVSEATVTGDGRRVFSYPVYAKQTLEDITLRFFDGTNTQIDLFMNDTEHTAIGTDGYSYSVGEYLAWIGAGEESIPMKDLAAALADYGAAADILFGHSAENPPTVQTDLSAITADTTVSYKITDTGSKPTGFSLIGATLLLQNETTLRVYFTAEGTPAFSVTVDGETATPVEKDGAYYVSIPGITAKELGAAHQICFGDYQINCSALTYAYSVLKNYPDSDTSEQAVKLRTLVRTLVRYNEAAVTYFGSK